MKTIILVLFCLLGILACATFMFVEHENQTFNSKVIQKELQAIKQERDSLWVNYKLRGDSLSIAFQTIKNLHSETEQAKSETKIYRKKFESIRFVKYETDSARQNALKKLYKTYQP